ncbi:MAG: site-specific DNA-methyltransferase [Syntrophomonadaceae bacterium]|jgi:adenine-specific DNA-methyltransferase
MDRLKMHSVDKVADNVKLIASLFPHTLTEVVKGYRQDGSAIVEQAIDFDILRQELSGAIVDTRQERYQFTWPDKKKSILLANAPIAKTLRPCREESMDFDTTGNLYIEGDNLDVLKLLQETYLGKIRMIYIDPPYNTGNDFIYEDNFAQHANEYLAASGQYDKDGNRLVQNTENNGRFHTDWLNMIYPRLKLARDLLSDDGVIFISIDDNEVANLRKVGDEIFGASNFVGCAGRITKKSNNKGDYWAPNFDYLLTYVKNRLCARTFFGGVNYDAYKLIDEDGPHKGEKYQLVRLYMSTIQNRNPEQRYWIECPDGSKVIPPGKTFPPQRPELGDGIWRWTRTKFEQEREKIVIKPVRSSNLLNENFEPAKWNVYTKTYLNDVINNSSAKPNSFIENYINQLSSHELKALDIPFDYAKPSAFIKYLIEISKSDGDSIIMDFFSGSATTADAVMQLNAEDGGNRRYIMVQLPEAIDEKTAAFKAGYKNICELGKERIRRAGKKILKEHPEAIGRLDAGFRVLKLDSTNMQDVYYQPAEYSQSKLFELQNNIKPDRTPEDLLFQVMLDLGVLLSSPIEETLIGGKQVFNVAEGYLIACFDTGITGEVVTKIAQQHPYYAVFRDSGMASDSIITNFDQIFAAYSPATIRKII